MLFATKIIFSTSLLVEGLKAFPKAKVINQARTKVDQNETDLKSALTMFDSEKTANKTCKEAAW